MNRIRITRRQLALAAAAAAVTLAAGLPAGSALAAPDKPASASSEPLVANDVRGSIGYLMATYKVDEKEALRRLELQRRTTDIQDWMKKVHPDDYAGLWIDQDNGGLLRIGSTRPSSVEAALKDQPDRTHIKVFSARWSLKDLEATQARLNKALNSDPNPKIRTAETVVNVKTNTVDVFSRAGADAAGASARSAADVVAAQERVSAGSPSLRSATASEGDMVKLKQLVVGREKDSPVGPGCSPRSCAPPMRAGMRLDILRNSAAPVGDPYRNAWWGQCTNGLNVYAQYTGERGTLTAGHCVVGCYKEGVTPSFYTDAGQAIGTEVYDFENGGLCNQGSTYPNDYAVMPYQSWNAFSYWLGPHSERLADSWCFWSESTTPCTDGSFRLTGYPASWNVFVGEVVCGTGSGDDSPNSGYTTGYWWHPGTRCGSITALDGGIITNICSRPGDSGGPLFSEVNGKAYGILSNGTEASGPCTSPQGSEWSSYSIIFTVLNHLNAQLTFYRGADNYHWNWDYLE